MVTVQDLAFPVMKTAYYRGGCSGMYVTIPDEHPMIGSVSEVRRFYCLMCWSSHGFKHSPYIEELMAELVTEWRTSEVDLIYLIPPGSSTGA